MKDKAVIGVIGLAVMGENLALNFAGRGFLVAVYNRTPERMEKFMADRAGALPLTGCRSLAEFVGALARPRKIILMIKAGAPVDDCLGELAPLLEPGDIVMDGGNSYYPDTARRGHELAKQGVHYLGVGISGGEEGALHGPSMMPGGDHGGWAAVEPILKAAAAQVDGVPCCEWIGPEGAGHYVKMVHNGIEYADMQLLAEAYGFLRDRMKLSSEEILAAFEQFQRGPLAGYLADITVEILRTADPDAPGLLLDHILDTPGQKGTGRWTSLTALETNTPVPTLTQAVYQRGLDADKSLRLRAAKLLPGSDEVEVIRPEDRETMIDALESALFASKVCAYAQGFALLRAAELQFGWHLDYAEIALLWRGGCIIRAKFLDAIAAAYQRDPGLENLLFDRYFREALELEQCGWRVIVADGAASGTALPAMASALAYYDSLRTAHSPANLIQAQRDFFGAHTYERTDRPRGEFFHHHWNR